MPIIGQTVNAACLCKKKNPKQYHQNIYNFELSYLYWPLQFSISWALIRGIIDRSTPEHNAIKTAEKQKIFERRADGAVLVTVMS